MVSFLATAAYLPWLLFAWLGIEAIWDLHSHDVPIWFSLAMLVPGIVLLGFNSFLASVLLAISLAATELAQHVRSLGIAGMFLPLVVIPLAAPACLPLEVGWGVLMALWLANVIGGADALAGLSLLLFFPSWMMLACIALGILAWFGLLLVVRYGKTAGLRLWTLLAARAGGARVTGIGAYALAALIYGILVTV